MKERLKRFDDLFMGVNYGVIGPLIGGVIYYYLQFSSRVTFTEFLEFIKRPEILSSVISLAVITNLAIFFLCTWLNALKAARGVVIATIAWGAVIVYLKFFA